MIYILKVVPPYLAKSRELHLGHSRGFDAERNVGGDRLYRCWVDRFGRRDVGSAIRENKGPVQTTGAD